MTDDEIRALLHGVYKSLYLIQQQLGQQQLLTTVLLGVLREKPEFEPLYAKHYAAVSRSGLGAQLDAALESLAAMLRALEEGKKLN